MTDLPICKTQSTIKVINKHDQCRYALRIRSVVSVVCPHFHCNLKKHKYYKNESALVPIRQLYIDSSSSRIWSWVKMLSSHSRKHVESRNWLHAQQTIRVLLSRQGLFLEEVQLNFDPGPWSGNDFGEFSARAFHDYTWSQPDSWKFLSDVLLRTSRRSAAHETPGQAKVTLFTFQMKWVWVCDPGRMLWVSGQREACPAVPSFWERGFDFLSRAWVIRPKIQ